MSSPDRPPTAADRRDRLRVLFLDHSATPGGGQLGLLRYLMRPSRHERSLVSVSAGPVWAPLAARGIATDTLVEAPFHRNQLITGLPALRRLIDRRCPDVVVANGLAAGRMLAMLPPGRVRPTRLFYLREGLDKWQGRGPFSPIARHLLLPRFDGFLANSEWTRSTIPDGLAPAAVALPLNGIEGGRRAPRPTGRPLRIITLSRLEWWKGLHLLVQALAEVEDRRPDVEFSWDVHGGGSSQGLAGDAGYEVELRRSAAALRSPVRFHGHTDDIAPVLDAGDVLVLPSVRPEPYGQVVAQAMAAGLLVVAAGHGGPLEQVHDGIDGRVSIPGDAHDLAAAIISAWDEPEAVARMREAATAVAVTASDDLRATQLDDAIDRLVGGRTRQSITVLHTVEPTTSTQNPFADLLIEALPPEVTAYHFSWGALVRGDHDLVHVQWPEKLVTARSPLKQWLKRRLFSLGLLRAGLRRTPIVVTVHNVGAHEGLDAGGARLIRRLDRVAATHVLMSPAAIDLPPRARTVQIPHGSYHPTIAADLLTADGDEVATDAQLLHFGLIRPYKQVPSLIAAYAGSSLAGQVPLRIVGEPIDQPTAAAVRAAAAAVPGVQLDLQAVDQVDLHRLIRRSRLVVLPYRQLYNSGALLLALTLRRPVLVPRTPSTLAAQQEFGAGWVHCYPGPDLRSSDLESAWCGCEAPRAAIDWSARDWSVIGRRYTAVYRQALQEEPR